MAAWEAVQSAVRAAPEASEVERALIGALAKRYSPNLAAERAPLDRAYAEAMRSEGRPTVILRVGISQPVSSIA